MPRVLFTCTYQKGAENERLTEESNTFKQQSRALLQPLRRHRSMARHGKFKKKNLMPT